MSTQEKAINVEVQKARDLFKDAIESLSEGFALYDEDRRLVLFNKRYKEMNQAVSDILEPGLDWEILMRETARKGIYTDAVGHEDKWISDRLENALEYFQNYELQHADGTFYLVSVHPTALGGFVVTRTDITAKKQAESLERDSDLLVRTVLDASSAVVVMARIGGGEILYRSPAALKLFGPTENARQHYVSSADRADFITDMLADGQVDEYRMTFLNAKAEHFPALVSGRFAEYKGEEVVVSSIVDLTEQVKTEALIRKVLEACPVPIQMTNAQTGKLMFSSPETTALFGRVESSKTYYANPSERQQYLKELRKNGWLNDRKTEYINAKGNRFWGAHSARLIEYNSEQVIVSNTRDLTDELAIQDELEHQRQLLFQNEKMSALGELLAGVAHELNNPLSVVVGHSLMLREEVRDTGAIRRIEKISSAAERCARIVKTFLAMARQQPTKMESTDISLVIATAIDVASYGEKSDGLDIRYKLNEEVPNILADADQITQVIINLVINAEQAITQAGVGNRIQVTAHNNRKGTKVKIFVEDNGPGVPDHIKARIFEPFFTTKDIGEGTGIGLSFCHRIILSHGGEIWLDQDYSQGCRFGIKLPIAPPTDNIRPQAKTTPQSPEKIKVLIIDDEVEVGELTSEILRKGGLHVDFSSSGAGAIGLLEKTRYDVLLSDLNMPEMDGRELYETIERDFPEMLNSTGFLTGDTMGMASQKFLQESKRPYLEKPVSPEELRELVYGLVDQREDKSDGNR